MNQQLAKIQEALEKLGEFTVRIDSSKKMQDLDRWLIENLPAILSQAEDDSRLLHEYDSTYD